VRSKYQYEADTQVNNIKNIAHQ